MKIFGITLNSRQEEKEILQKIIHSLNISQEEKEIYLISIDILDDVSFDSFFQKIIKQIDIKKLDTNQKYNIEPFTSQII